MPLPGTPDFSSRLQRPLVGYSLHPHIFFKTTQVLFLSPMTRYIRPPVDHSLLSTLFYLIHVPIPFYLFSFLFLTASSTPPDHYFNTATARRRHHPTAYLTPTPTNNNLRPTTPSRIFLPFFPSSLLSVHFSTLSFSSQPPQDRPLRLHPRRNYPADHRRRPWVPEYLFLFSLAE